jgi:phage shock protein C
MHCTRCGFELRDDDRFCSRCGNRLTADRSQEIPRPLMLDKRNKKIAGVCAGFARYLGIDVVLVRVLWLGIAICTGVGFFVYLAAWIVLPSDCGLETRDMMARAPQMS